MSSSCVRSSPDVRIVTDLSKFKTVNKQHGGDVLDTKSLFPVPEETDRVKYNLEKAKDVRNADILMFKDKRKGVTYIHFGIAYIPKEKTGTSVDIWVIELCATVSGVALYQQRKLVDVLGKRWLGIFEEETLKPLSVSDTIERAKSKLGCKTEKYDVRTWNCESFARWCKYDDKRSHQATIAEERLGEDSLGRLCYCLPYSQSSEASKEEEGFEECQIAVEEEAADQGS